MSELTSEELADLNRIRLQVEYEEHNGKKHPSESLLLKAIAALTDQNAELDRKYKESLGKPSLQQSDLIRCYTAEGVRQRAENQRLTGELAELKEQNQQICQLNIKTATERDEARASLVGMKAEVEKLDHSPGCALKQPTRPPMPEFKRPVCRRMTSSPGCCERCDWYLSNPVIFGPCNCIKSMDPEGTLALDHTRWCIGKI